MRRWWKPLVTLTAAGTLLAGTATVQASATGGDKEWIAQTFPSGNARLQDAARVDVDTTWAVGWRQYGEGRQRSSGPVMFSHDDGTPDWREIPVPTGLSSVRTVTAGPAGSVWVAGSKPWGAESIPTAAFDGGWHVRQAPAPAGSWAAGFRGLAAIADNDVWAVGWWQPAEYLTFHGLIQHWDGSAWQQIQPPVIDSDYWTLSGVVATAADDIWASGTVGTEEGRRRPLLLHYDGDAWARVAAPDVEGINGEFYDLAATGPDDVWAVGTEETVGGQGEDRGLIAHFDGNRWTKVDSGTRPGGWHAVSTGPSGVAVVGTRFLAHKGTYEPIGMTRTDTGWQTMLLPAGDGPEGRSPTAVVSAGRTLTVVGMAPQGEAENGEPVPPMPFALSRG
ncbi:hypothetical protein ABZZ79_32465 [Streptomyces sp. NPDC006458]|uniref:hypothetical protein n=1 Tax=Streptomyces sp. NPDC006458 TaxID=3154302 RepID=UPI0033A1B882